jgi:autotransporter-associated beta strand protein
LADVLVWDPLGLGTGSDATGTWTNDPSSPPVFDSPSAGLVVWDNTANANDTAQFGVGFNVSSTVNLGSNITAGGVLFNSANTTAYSVTPQNGSVLTLTGSTGFTVNTGTSAVADTVSAPVVVSTDQTWTIGTNGSLIVSGGVTGAVGLTVAGTGNLTLGGTTAFTGVNLSGGRISVYGNTALGTGALTVGLNATHGAAYASGSTPFLYANTAGNTNIGNAIVLPSPTTTSYYAIQKAVVGTALDLSGSLSGGNANLFLQLDTPNGGDSTTLFELAGNNSGLTAGQVRLNRGRVQLDTANALGSATLFLQSNANAAGNVLFNQAMTLPNAVTFGTTANNAISNNGYNVTLSGVLTTAVTWVSTGAGTLTLSNAADAITGTTSITGGAVQIGATGSTNNFTLGNSSNGVTGTGSLIKVGTGVLNLPGTASTYSGGTNLAGGSINTSSGTPLGTGPLTVGLAATSATSVSSSNAPFLNVSSTSTVTLPNAINLPTTATAATVYTLSDSLSGYVGHVVLGGVLGGGNAYTTLELNTPTSGDGQTAFEFNASNGFATGTTVRLNRGRLILDNANALGSASLYVQTNPDTTAGSGDVVFNGTYTLPNNITTGATYEDTYDVPGANVATLTGNFSSGSTVIWDKLDTGTLVLTNAADRFVGVKLAGGTLQINNAGVGTMALGALTRAVGGVIDFGSTTTGGGASTSTANTNGILGGYATTDGGGYFAAQTSTGLVTKYTAASLTSVLGNTATGYATVNVDVDSSPTLNGAATPNSLRFITTGGTVTLGGATQVLSGGILVTPGVTGPTAIAGGTLTGGSATAAGDLIVNQANATYATTIASTIANASSGFSTSLVKSGAGTVVLTASNTYSGPTYIYGGTLQVGDGTTDGSIANTTAIADGGTLAFNLVGAQTVGVVISSGGSLIKSGPGTLTLSATNTYTGGTTVNGGTLVLTAAGTASGGAIRGNLTINNGGTVTAAALYDVLGTATGTNVPTLTINAGGVFNIADTAGNDGYDTNLVLAGGSVTNTSSGGFQFNTGYGISSSGPTTSTISAPVVIRGTSFPIATAAGVASGVDLMISGPVSNGSGGTAPISKTGTGVLQLTGANTYTGGTLVTGGTLRVDNPTGMGTGTGPVIIGDGANASTGVLAGTGSAGNGSVGLVTIQKGGTITAGTGATATDTPGTLTTGSQAWNSSGAYVAKFSADGSTNDRLVMSGLTVSAGASNTSSAFVVNVQGSTAESLPANTYVLAVDTGTTTAITNADPFTLGKLTLEVNGGTAPAGYTLAEGPDTTGIGGGAYDLSLVVGTAAAPEPTSLLLAAAAVAPLLGRRRRR